MKRYSTHVYKSMDCHFPIYFTPSLNPRLYSTMMPYNKCVDPEPDMLLPMGGKSKKVYVDLLSKIKFDYPKYPGDEVNAVLFMTSAINGFVYRVATGEINMTYNRVIGLSLMTRILSVIVTDDVKAAENEWTTVTKRNAATGRRYVTRMLNKLHSKDMSNVFDPVYQFLPLIFVNCSGHDWHSDLSRNFMLEVEKRIKYSAHNGDIGKWAVKQEMINVYFKLFKELIH